MSKFQIVGISIKANCQLPVSWSHFSRKSDLRGFSVTIAVADKREKAITSLVLHDEFLVEQDSNGYYLYEANNHMPPVQLVVSPDYRTIETHLQKYADVKAQEQKLNHLLRTAFECRFCYEGIVSLHAACVELGDFAVAFTGHSGLGKSTRACAWVEGLGAQWISGDRPAVRLEKQGSTACGVPWDGKEQIFRDVEKPLKCIMEVRRSPANYVRRLSEDQARQLIMQQSFVPMRDTDAAVLAMANVRRLVRQTPVYRVFCGPDAEDAKVIYDILVNHPELIREEKEQMKIKEGFVLRNVVDEFIVMPTGDNIAKFEGAVVLNEVSAFIFKQLENPVSRDDLLSAMLGEYDVDEATAAADLDALLEKFAEMGVLEK